MTFQIFPSVLGRLSRFRMVAASDAHFALFPE